MTTLMEAQRWAQLQLAAASVGAALANVVRDDGAALEAFKLRVSRSAEFDDPAARLYYLKGSARFGWSRSCSSTR